MHARSVQATAPEELHVHALQPSDAGKVLPAGCVVPP
jgi:hypothetical protein